MSDMSWDDFTEDALGPELSADVAPLLDAAATDTWQAEHAAGWGDWNAEIADASAHDVAAELDYAQRAYAAGFEGAGDAALNRASIALESVEEHSAVAADHYGVAADEYGAAAAGLETAAGYIDDAASYDTTSYDTTSYDTTSYDTTSYDTTSYDTTSYDTTSYDTTSYDTGTTDTY